LGVALAYTIPDININIKYLDRLTTQLRVHTHVGNSVEKSNWRSLFDINNTRDGIPRASFGASLLFAIGSNTVVKFGVGAPFINPRKWDWGIKFTADI